MPKRCHVCKIECEKPMQCSKCHHTIYCSTECQTKDWKIHKRSVCVKPPFFHKFDKMMNKLAKGNTPYAFINRVEDAVWAERKRNPEPVDRCDGCFQRFRGTPPSEDDLFEASLDGESEPEVAPEVGDMFKHCDECDWTICEGCSLPESQGIPFFDRPPGTCRCPTSNFGKSYCLTHPIYLDGDGAKPYHGDRHPPIEGSVYSEDAFEKKERACRTCGVIARCLKKEHLKDAAPHVLQ